MASIARLGKSRPHQRATDALALMRAIDGERAKQQGRNGIAVGIDARLDIPQAHSADDMAIRIAGDYEGSIHLLATDLVMPRMSGLEVASQLTQSRPAIRILLMSGYPNESAMRHGVPPGAALLQKPFNSIVLARAVRQVLDAR
jgi:CheY-like chemotaxis protein